MIEPQHHTTKIEKTAYYSTLGKASKNVKYLWIVCHGYGQLASRIVNKFTSIHSEEHLFIAPEGLSRFYWDEKRGIVGASWMTKKDRLIEIAEYSNYLQHLIDQYLPMCAPETKVIAFGFSQGCATIWRWMMDKKPDLHALVTWAGMTPEDLDYLSHKDYMDSIKLFMIYGTNDEYLTEPRVKFQLKIEQEQGLNIRHFSFDGKHEVDRKVLEELLPHFL